MSLLTFFTRRNKEPDTPEPDMPLVPTAPAHEATNSPKVLMRFLTHGGAAVEVYEPAESPKYTLRCLGCDYDFSSTTSTYVREDANAHASNCRAMPKPTA
ncbi:hypothetical protein [Streptomyces lateritius]|uniref:hypothetical protein n=1 Tax=Streptomyces lateritius TaxID=67313 RepID=UPI001673DD23|nr:hypothetical protein [Streptomyces lateritius]GGU12560.1 hypothetical protein GCM10010272_67140 [Streptomyces lateritius]